MFYSSISANENSGEIKSKEEKIMKEKKDCKNNQQPSSYIQQNYVINSNNVGNNENKINQGCLLKNEKTGELMGINEGRLSVSNDCNCSFCYINSCNSANCVNKFVENKQITQLNYAQPQQIIIKTTSGDEIVSYDVPMQSYEINSNLQDVDHLNNLIDSSNDKMKEINIDQQINEKELRRQRLAEMARLRYQNLSQEEKKAVNARRMLLRKRKRQREREMEELEAILRSTNDIEYDVVFIGKMKEKRQRESRARAARSRYHSMTPEERRVYNQKRRMRQLGFLNVTDSNVDAEAIKKQIEQQNARKAELARQRYHRMSVEERKAYNKRRTESLRKRRMEEEALLATPAGQIDSEALQRAQQIMIRNAIRAEKARERYKRKAPEEREKRRLQKAIKEEEMEHGNDPSTSYHKRNSSGDFLSAIEREVDKQTLEARQILEQKACMSNAEGIKQEPTIRIHHQLLGHLQPQPEIINVCPVVSNIIPNNHVSNQNIQNSNALFASTQTIVHAAPASVTGGAVVMPVEVKPGAKYISYMQLPAGTHTQSGFILADGQFVTLQEPVQGYTIEQPIPSNYDNNFSHLSPTVLRTSNQPVAPGQPIIIGQRVELINASDPQNYQTHGNAAPNTIHVVNYGAPGIQQIPQQTQIQQLQHPHNVITQHVPQHVTVASPSQQQDQYTTIRQQQQIIHNSPMQQISLIPTNASTSYINSNVDPALIEKIQTQRAKRAERARRRYHEMSPQARHEFNAKRALALKMSRIKDDELCRLGEEIEMTGKEIDENLRNQIEQARMRRAKRAETARQKYQKMSPEQRKIHNAMRDAQRRQRKKEMEEK